jgi:protein-S-isoprenylcysteine O-methyltransferase Ste14
MGGIAIVAFHQFWRGAAAIIVSVLGWALVVRGTFLMAFPDTFASLADRMIGATGIWQGAYVVMALIGLYLSYVGWRPVRKSPQSSDVHNGIDYPHAA